MRSGYRGLNKIYVSGQSITRIVMEVVTKIFDLYTTESVSNQQQSTPPQVLLNIQRVFTIACLSMYKLQRILSHKEKKMVAAYSQIEEKKKGAI